MPRAERQNNMGEKEHARLRRLLAEHGEFPAGHRPLVWRALLGLPEKRREYDALRAPADGGSAAGAAALKAAEACRARAARVWPRCAHAAVRLS